MNNEKYTELNFAKPDIDRLSRRGNSEAIFCECKTSEQPIKIFTEFKRAGQNVLGTRASAEPADKVQKALPEVKFDNILQNRDKITNDLKKLGIKYVTPNLEGFRSGSMDI